MAQSPVRRSAPDFVRHAALRVVVAHWLSLLDEDAVPDRRRLDPAEMLPALPYVWLCQREPTGRYRVRLAGAEINELLHQPLRGRTLDEVLTEAEWDELKPKFDEALDRPALIWSEGPIFDAEPEGPHGECVMMPLTDRGRRVIVLGCTVHGLEYVPRPGRLFIVPAKTIEIVPLAEL